MSSQSASPSSSPIPDSMTAVLARSYGGAEVLEIDDTIYWGVPSVLKVPSVCCSMKRALQL